VDHQIEELLDLGLEFEFLGSHLQFSFGGPGR
jgi:hypothetical protein